MKYLEAKNYARGLFKKSFEGLELEFMLKHCENVEKYCLKLAKDKKVDKNRLKIASWLHDIGRTVNPENHSKISIELAKKEFGKLNIILIDCIKNHGSSETPLTDEGKIFQFSDKLSIMNYETMNLVFTKSRNRKKDMGLFKMVSQDLLKLMEKYPWQK